jgi:LacI family transcriptional regulator
MSAKRQPTLSDVARRSGVGTTTVSRVINGGAHVSPETLKSVHRAIKELGFVPNHSARMLKGEPNKAIGLIIPSIADPFFASCAEAIQKLARDFGWLVIVTATNNESELELENIDTLFRRTDGLLIAPSNSSDERLIDRLSSLSIPVVCFDRPLDDPGIPGVVTDNYQSAKAATRHLLEHGYKRILCMGGEVRFHTMLERSRGYAAAMREYNLKPLIDTSPELRSAEDTALVLRRHLDGRNPPRAIFSLKNTTTIHAYGALQRFGVRMPDQMALVGHDDFVLAATLRPSVTVVQQPIEEIGRIAGKLLFDRVFLKQEQQPAEPTRSRIVRLKSRLIVRASCGCEPVAEDETAQS